jgi:hypothetical protein
MEDVTVIFSIKHQKRTVKKENYVYVYMERGGKEMREREREKPYSKEAKNLKQFFMTKLFSR